MKRVLLCAYILVVMIVSSIVLLNRIENKGFEITKTIDNAIVLFEAGDLEKSAQQINQAIQQWHSYYSMLSLVMPNENIQQITQSVSKLSALLKDCKEEFIAECESVKYAITLLYENEYPSLRTII